MRFERDRVFWMSFTFASRLIRDRGARILLSEASSLLSAVLVTALIFLGDHVLLRSRLPYVLTALIDVPAHALTALLAIWALVALRPRWGEFAVWLGALLGGTLIDLDHLPAALGWNGIANAISDGTDRPYSHSLLTLALILAAALLVRGARRRAGLAATLGLAVHLLRDLVDGGTVALLWPVTKHSFTLPYDDYAAWLLLCLALSVIGQRIQRAGRGMPLR